MPWVFDCDGDAQKMGIYSVSEGAESDDAPLYDPYTYLSRVRFHSDFAYPSVVDDRQISMTLSDNGVANPIRSITHTLFAHGQSGAPFVLGSIYSQGLGDVPFGGTYAWRPLMVCTPIAGRQQAAVPAIGSPERYGWDGRIVSLGANSTHVLLHEYINGTSGSIVATNPARNITLRILVTDEIL